MVCLLSREQAKEKVLESTSSHSTSEQLHTGNPVELPNRVQVFKEGQATEKGIAPLFLTRFLVYDDTVSFQSSDRSHEQV